MRVILIIKCMIVRGVKRRRINILTEFGKKKPNESLVR